VNETGHRLTLSRLDVLLEVWAVARAEDVIDHALDPWVLKISFEDIGGDPRYLDCLLERCYQRLFQHSIVVCKARHPGPVSKLWVLEGGKEVNALHTESRIHLEAMEAPRRERRMYEWNMVGWDNVAGKVK